MVWLIRPRSAGLSCIAVALGFVACAAWADPPLDAKPEPATTVANQPKGAALYGLPGEDPPEAFVPRTPRTVEDQRQVEALRDFSTARALEDQRAWSDAIALLEEALKLEPDSVSVLRRLSRLCFLFKRTDQALSYSRRVLDADPGDTDTISRLINHYVRNGDFMGAEAMLKSVLDNPKLGPHMPGRLLAEYELGKLDTKLGRIKQAADAFAKLLDELDEKEANRLSFREQLLILGDEPADAYLEFGKVFDDDNRLDLAIRAYERGLVYNEDHPLIPLSLAQALLKSGKGEQALRLVERFLKRQPQGSDGYELLAKILTQLKREGEITPRLEEAAKLDSKNLSLQYALADRYRESGQVEKAEALYKSLLEAQPTPQGYSALATSLLKRKKAAQLLKVFTEARKKEGGFEAVTPQIKAVIADPGFAGEVLDSGNALLSSEPPGIDRSAIDILAVIASESNQLDKLVPILRLTLKQDPSPQLYREISHALEGLRKYGEAGETIEQMMAKYPEERNARTLTQLGEYRRRADNFPGAIESLREALKLEPVNPEAQFVLGWSLSMVGKLDEAIDLFKSVLKNDPSNAPFNRLYGSILLQNGKNEEAIALYKELLERYPNNEEIIEITHSGLSVAYVNLGDFAKGEAELEILFQHNPDDPGVNNDLGYLYADQGKKLEQAESMIRRALQEKPDESAYLDSLGWVLYKRGKAKEALEPLEKAVKTLNNGGDATIFEHLGDVYFRLQENAKAKTAWEQAEKSAAKAIPTDKRLPEIRKKLESLGKLAPVLKPASDDSP
ncbi:tetratricopeptide repeat protein [Singulisphaera acidiphila]|uniref:Tetratricopeptide repeat protein n=1 Tax=Singulisphaera acidiphila (strain ATCC BAA-1392 / DSM 18658 / VKM B-2454 / MOB10) TaxID=886293 RepID=L0DK59_SINAD|nr:tetratricopeptide repeat protein [Singulisphaera acidiphila]AGA29642.1 tetratricopeptide repeat protein [Singulisphaera acidiphila DSM 18658]